DLEQDIAGLLRKYNKNVILTVNKVDNPQRLIQANEFYGMGFQNVCFISAISGSGTGELLEEMIKFIDAPAAPLNDGLPRFAILGQPNVGKSSLVNMLVGEERNIVTDIAGTTRDSLHSHYKLFQKEFIIIDTAGIRKKAKVNEDLEFYSVIRAVKSLDEADVCILLIDAQTSVEKQDLAILSMAEKKRKGVVFAINKWDLVKKETNTMKQMEEDIRRKIAPFRDVPIVFTSVKEKQRVFKVVEVALEVHDNRKRVVDDKELTEKMMKSIEQFPHPSVRGQFLQIKKITQVPASSPTFIFEVNFPNDVRDSYRQFLDNKLRSHFNFTGVPLNIFFRKK
ncbi:MAG: ribosome biogenesis GTPase Der, partial [Chitinophagales bacterium]|nr:ribosome biogenesis GTPase Der [Chitinophagales bacterium]